jgi:lipopolysaccharide transport system permease protein
LVAYGDLVPLIITPQACKETHPLTSRQRELDKSRVDFILKRRIRGIAGRKRLGSVWLILHPILLSLVYVFVFTVIRSNPNLISIFVGITMFNIFSSSIKSGVGSVKDFSGGIKGERVRTSVIASSMVRYRIIDSVLQSAGVSILLFLFFGVPVLGLSLFVLICSIIGVAAEQFALNLSLSARRLPDITNFIDYGLMLMFFGSPVLYPLSLTQGLHRSANEWNPFTIFVEGGRSFVGVESEFNELIGLKTFTILFAFLIFSLRGHLTLDKFRWEVSSWS